MEVLQRAAWSWPQGSSIIGAIEAPSAQSLKDGKVKRFLYGEDKIVKAMPGCWNSDGQKLSIGLVQCIAIWVWVESTIFWGGNFAMNPAFPCSPSDVGLSKAGAAMTVWPGLKIWVMLPGHISLNNVGIAIINHPPKSPFLWVV